MTSVKQYATVLALAWLMTGCSHMAVSDGSLGYKQAHLNAPIQLPADQKTRAFIPMYDLPPASAESSGIFTNKKGNRYQLPLPPTLTQQ